jgi:hypothetical protein
MHVHMASSHQRQASELGDVLQPLPVQGVIRAQAAVRRKPYMAKLLISRQI